MPILLDLEDFNLKVEPAAGGDAPRREPALPVALVRGDLELTHLALQHTEAALVPPDNDLQKRGRGEQSDEGAIRDGGEERGMWITLPTPAW